MKFMELTYKQRSHTGGADIVEKFMKDMEGSGWEIYDRGNDSANWCNSQMGTNYNSAETYAELKAKFTRAGLMLDLDNIGKEASPYAYRVYRGGVEDNSEELKIAIAALQEANDGFTAIASGLTTDINKVEQETKLRAHQHRIEVQAALRKLGVKNV